MSSEGKQNFEKEHENTGITVKDSQSLNTTSHANDRDESRLSHDKCQHTDSVHKPQESTDVLASTSVVFWKDPKFWIQIGIMGVIQLVICVYMSVIWRRDTANLISCRHGGAASESSCEDRFCDAACKLSQRDVLNIASQNDFENLLDVDWDKRKKVLEKDFNRKFKDLFDEEWDTRKKILEEDLSRKLEDKETVVFNAVVTKHGHFERNTPVNIIYDQVL
uniref:Uncharacterized protein LOC111102584 n=1 Tax=Crassostrea virginica TaxID=6565 RepID=A0A8B8AIU5_CRAVI|nr:uncharacterized protein LOC111102584 [Crassostrea virginica]XP_022291096.1 uncharacterized protein LOC111102584 [Crassostrea virginica]XP_022291097.1 uncharacterized protein LOC111102584 [Crassostrea virginica]XP_022291098.1 uncharacterized protein LOC111102584 [Crassostrea virginica]XP_022291099.1 uncharacterized protein LOC111102584 [Crassostrea virginica]XP_022291100.1 uncharacterized protein LOC111102584 [Crassostrea virginica]XP_022291101.1 uncharacterized protein LOC111102584 [Crasso